MEELEKRESMPGMDWIVKKKEIWLGVGLDGFVENRKKGSDSRMLDRDDNDVKEKSVANR